MKALAYVLYFGLLGPGFGGLLLFVSTGLWSAVERLPSDPSESTTLLLLAFGAGISSWPLAIVFGGIPGSITGLAYWALKSRTNMVALGRFRVALIMFLVGAVVAGAFPLGVSASKRVVAMFLLAGGGASAMCALLLQPSARPPNNALERPPDA